MIEIKKDAYIVGIWFAERKMLGKVFIYALKGDNKNEWVGHIRYRYDNGHINMHMDHSSHHNSFICKDVPESIMIKVCQDRIAELNIIFCHDMDYVMVHGTLDKIKELAKNKDWLPPIYEIIPHKPKRHHSEK